MRDYSNEPAFPPHVLPSFYPGLTRLEWFAGCALQGLLADYNTQRDIKNTDDRYKLKPDGMFNFSEVIAFNAFEFAEAMCQEAERRMTKAQSLPRTEMK